ncbi:MAG: hypothetical protein ABIA63_13950, partial [bacterium]
MKIKILETELYLLNIQSRMEFKFGMAQASEMNHVFVRLLLEADGKKTWGISAENLAPKWFTKDPNRPVEKEIEEMIGVIKQALLLATGMHVASLFEIWHEHYRLQKDWGKTKKYPSHLSGF